MLQVLLDGMGKLRVPPPIKLGGPNAPVNPFNPLVSATRHGVMATKTIGFTGVCACARGVPEAFAKVLDLAVVSDSARLGCQNSGAGQFLSGAISRMACALSAIADRTIKDTLRLK
jgi:hypothetical protein